MGRSRALRGAVVALALMSAGCVRIGPGQQGVLWSAFGGGTQEQAYLEGVHFMLPWNRMYIYNMQLQDQGETMDNLTIDGLTVSVDVSIRYRPEPQALARLHKDIGDQYYDKILRPILRNVTRDVVGQYRAEEIYSSRRADVETGISKGIRAGADGKFIEIDAVLLRGVKLPETLKGAIETKLQSEQSALQMQYVLDREKKEAERKRIEAEGVRDFQRIVSEGINEQLLRWKGIEATEGLAQSQNAKVVVIGSGKDGLPLILGGAN
jgi:regulator of protease activity HflC (stomatin/prohibitin superfamily)